MVWAGVEAWWVSAKVPAQKPGVTELLDALWWLPGPEPVSLRDAAFPLADEGLTSQAPIPVNRLDSAGWVQHGLSPRQAASAVRYRDAVGGFHNVKVLSRMRVLPDGWMKQHKGRLVFPAIGMPESAPGESKSTLVPKEKDVAMNEAEPTGGLVPLNTADSMELIALRGVGPWVAGRILQARRRWGGCAEAAQLGEALGWDSLAQSIMPLFSCDAEQIERRCPDSLTAEGWRQLPGVGRREAETIVRYVGQHGGDPKGLFACLALDSVHWERLLPYLECRACEDP